MSFDSGASAYSHAGGAPGVRSWVVSSSVIG